MILLDRPGYPIPGGPEALLLLGLGGVLKIEGKKKAKHRFAFFICS